MFVTTLSLIWILLGQEGHQQVACTCSTAEPSYTSAHEHVTIICSSYLLFFCVLNFPQKIFLQQKISKHTVYTNIQSWVLTLSGKAASGGELQHGPATVLPVEGLPALLLVC